jgi:hypothetical protein
MTDYVALKMAKDADLTPTLSLVINNYSSWLIVEKTTSESFVFQKEMSEIELPENFYAVEIYNPISCKKPRLDINNVKKLALLISERKECGDYIVDGNSINVGRSS